VSARRLLSPWTILIVAELVAILGFFLPWSQHLNSLLQVTREILLINLDESSGFSEVSVYYPIAFIISLVAGLISLLIMLLGHLTRFARIRSPRIIALLNSLMMAGPLIYVQTWRFSTGYEPRDTMQEQIEQTSIGWILTLVGSLLVILVAVYMFQRGVRSDSTTCSSRSPVSIARERITFAYLAFPLLLILGSVVITSGFIQTWITGGISDPSRVNPPFGDWSVLGIGLYGPIFLVLIATMVSIVSVIASQFVARPSYDTVRLIAECFVVLLLGLTVFFCFTFPVHTISVEARFVNVELQLGLFLCVVGELVLLTTLAARDLRLL